LSDFEGKVRHGHKALYQSENISSTTNDPEHLLKKEIERRTTIGAR